MKKTFITGEEPKLRFNEEPEFRVSLNQFQIDELMIAAMLLPVQQPKSIPNDKKDLIEICLEELALWHSSRRHDELNSVRDFIQKYAPRTDESQWLKDPMPKRLEVFLRNEFDSDWVDITGASNKTRFLLTYSLLIKAAHEGDSRNLFATDTYQPSLNDLKRKWTHLESLNELKNLTETDTKDFLEHFSKEYKKIALKHAYRSTLLKIDLIHLDTIEDALIWLDFFSHIPLERSAITDKIRKSWQQKQYRKASSKTQKNFNLSEATISTLKTLADEYGLSETKVITILINEELKNDIYIKEVLNRANAIQRAIEGE